MNTSDDEAVESINNALKGELEGVDVDRIVDFKLRRLDREYNQTVAAEIKTESEPAWQADFNVNYEQCPSDEDEEEVTEELPKNLVRDFSMNSEQVTRIKEIMAKIKLTPPHWVRNIPDSAFSDMLKGRIFQK